MRKGNNNDAKTRGAPSTYTSARTACTAYTSHVMSDEPPNPPVDDDMEAQEVGTSDELAVTSDSINAPEPETETEEEPASAEEPAAEAPVEEIPAEEAAPVEEPPMEEAAAPAEDAPAEEAPAEGTPAQEPEDAGEIAADPEPAAEPEAPAPVDAAPTPAAAPAVAPPVPVAAKMPPPRPFTKENIAPASTDPSESLFAKKTPVHAYLATNIQVAVRHALRALSAQRPEEPFVMASDVIRKWTPQSAPPRLSRPAGGVGVGAREYLESVGVLKVLHDGMCAMAKVRLFIR